MLISTQESNDFIKHKMGSENSIQTYQVTKVVKSLKVQEDQLEVVSIENSCKAGKQYLSTNPKIHNRPLT